MGANSGSEPGASTNTGNPTTQGIRESLNAVRNSISSLRERVDEQIRRSALRPPQSNLREQTEQREEERRHHEGGGTSNNEEEENSRSAFADPRREVNRQVRRPDNRFRPRITQLIPSMASPGDIASVANMFDRRMYEGPSENIEFHIHAFVPPQAAASLQR